MFILYILLIAAQLLLIIAQLRFVSLLRSFFAATHLLRKALILFLFIALFLRVVFITGSTSLILGVLQEFNVPRVFLDFIEHCLLLLTKRDNSGFKADQPAFQLNLNLYFQIQKPLINQPYIIIMQSQGFFSSASRKSDSQRPSLRNIVQQQKKIQHTPLTKPLFQEQLLPANNFSNPSLPESYPRFVPNSPFFTAPVTMRAGLSPTLQQQSGVYQANHLLEQSISDQDESDQQIQFVQVQRSPHKEVQQSGKKQRKPDIQKSSQKKNQSPKERRQPVFSKNRADILPLKQNFSSANLNQIRKSGQKKRSAFVLTNAVYSFPKKTFRQIAKPSQPVDDAILPRKQIYSGIYQ